MIVLTPALTVSVRHVEPPVWRQARSLVSRMPHELATEMMHLCRKVSARAYEVGVVNRGA